MKQLPEALGAVVRLGVIAACASAASPAPAATRVVLCEEFTNRY